MSTHNSGAGHTPGRRLTDKELARELFVAGYHQALDDVAAQLVMRAGCSLDFLATLRAKAAAVQASAAIARATTDATRAGGES